MKKFNPKHYMDQYKTDADRKRIVNACCAWELFKQAILILILFFVPLIVWEWASANSGLIQVHMEKFDKKIEGLLK